MKQKPFNKKRILKFLNDPLWKLLELVLRIEIKKDENKALLTVTNFIQKNIYTMEETDKINAFEKLNSIVEQLNNE